MWQFTESLMKHIYIETRLTHGDFGEAHLYRDKTYPRRFWWSTFI